jgi:hypothetical protein
MTIDPRIYKKYSGRSGDPYSRMGEALAKSTARSSQLKASKDRSFSHRYVSGAVKARLWMGIIGSIVLLIALALGFL